MLIGEMVPVLGGECELQSPDLGSSFCIGTLAPPCISHGRRRKRPGLREKNIGTGKKVVVGSQSDSMSRSQFATDV